MKEIIKEGSVLYISKDRIVKLDEQIEEFGQMKKVNHGLRPLGYNCPRWFKPTLTLTPL